MTSKRERNRRRKEAHRREVARRKAEARNPRSCYCGPDDAFCGTCRVCGRPGHVRHFPGAVPYTGSWCDRHYTRAALLHPGGTYGCWLWGSALVFGVALVARLLAS